MKTNRQDLLHISESSPPEDTSTITNGIPQSTLEQ